MPQISRRKKPASRRRNKPRIQPSSNSIGNDLRPYRFTKMLDKGAITSTAGAEGLYAYQFTIGDLSEIASFTSVFDQYRISRIDVIIKPCSQPNNNASTAPPYAFCYVVTDYDDSAALASASLALNYRNVSILGPGQGHRRTFIPRCNIVVGSNGSLPSISKPAPWCDCADTSVIHYALKIAVTQSTSTNITTWRVFCRYFVDFRLVR